MLLAIDSATRTLSLALHDGQRIHAESTWNTSNRHTVELSPAIHKMVTGAGITFADLKLIAVSQGPGSFNGLRIGISLAKGLAMAINSPLIAIPTLDIIAFAQPPAKGALIAVAQAGRGRVCAQTYRWKKTEWVGQDDTQIVSWENLLSPIKSHTVICGEIDAEGQSAIEYSSTERAKPIEIASPTLSLRRAGFLAELGWKRWREGQPSEPALVVPLYLHQPGVPHP